MPHHQIICGDVIPTLKSLPDEYVDMLMTSVPYWGLRNYGEDTVTIWGGDKDCEHIWIEERSGLIHENRNNLSGTQEEVVGKRGTAYIKKYDDKKASFCSKCGAWCGQLGLEPTPELYIEHLRMVFAEVKRVLKPTGTCWANIGDTYGGTGGGHDFSKRDSYQKYNPKLNYNPNGKGGVPKCMCMIPERFAFMMIDLGYILRNKIIWRKPNPMPSSVKDRFNTTYEMLYFFSKSKKYWFDLDAVLEPWTDTRPADIKRAEENHPGYPGKYGKGYNAEYRDKIPGQGIKGQPVGNPILGKNPGDIFVINTQPYPEAHFAVFPEKLCEKPILAGCPAEVCSVCGMARARITERTAILEKGRNVIGLGPKTICGGGNGTTLHHDINIQTIGWTDCPCSEENKYQPGVILDPFAGSGTVGVAAEKLGRNSILIDIKKDYCEMAFKRLKPLVEQTDLSGTQSTITRTNF